mmetsp:Transcript_48544/g.128679  ORF Transcript_48544/g.128679 Transcript_48544/m.128679 type:complete len:147 (-) Transcript_48544:16-456(-)
MKMMETQRLRAIATTMTKGCRDARSPKPRSLTPSASQHPVLDHQRLTDEHNTKGIGAAPDLAVILAVCGGANFTARFGLQERSRCHGVPDVSSFVWGSVFFDVLRGWHPIASLWLRQFGTSWHPFWFARIEGMFCAPQEPSSCTMR